MASNKRDHLVKTAQDLFYQQGFRATGIDTILAASGVAKKTLYNHFKSKDELIIATLHRRDEQFMLMLKGGVERLSQQQKSKVTLIPIMAFFDTLSEWFHSEKFNGCMFINASAEYPNNADPIHVACAHHKQLVIQFIEHLLSDFISQNKPEISHQMAILADGAIVNAHTTNDLNAASYAKLAAEKILLSYG
mgnify:CR=1 FL=1